jgi:adenylylsulfate kinase-like enzyme
MTQFQHKITTAERQAHYGPRRAVTRGAARADSRKAMMSRELERRFLNDGVLIFAPDSDNVGQDLNSNRAFSSEVWREGIRCVFGASLLFSNVGLVRVTERPSAFASSSSPTRSRS